MRYNQRSVYNGHHRFTPVRDPLYALNFRDEDIPPPFANQITTEDNIILATQNDLELTTEG